MPFNSKSKNKKIEKESFLHPDTKKSVWALIFIGVSIILFLAKFQNAGPVGKFLYKIFDALFGIGYYLLPLIFLIMAGVFLTSERRKIHKIVFLGAALFVLSGLGIIDVIFENRSGIIGKTIGSLEIPFGYAASLIIVILTMVISFIITLNLPIKIRKRLKEEGKDKEIEIEVVNQEEIFKEKTKADSKDDKEEKDEKLNIPKTSLKIQNSRLKAKGYIAPPLDLLKSSVEKPTSGDLRANANIIKRTLEGFGVSVEMGEINIGPKVTRYSLKPAEGVKLSKIMALNQDLSLALAAHPIRIEAPIPGKSLVGVEVPNKASALVRLGSLMAYPEFAGSGLLGFVIGRDVSGEPIFTDIDKMPHLLISGSTGSGKSILLHTILISLLYKNSPETLRFILIDPKMVELSVYDGIPHLISPVITNAKKSITVLKWLVSEMERRYELFLKAGSRDISSYNKKNSEEVIPYIVIVVDELADIMATYGREIEGFVVRIAQMARATGIHLIVSTQRPSTEVVTGLIKANIRARVALHLPSQIDSRTILDTAGAEKLLGGGDLLFVSSEFSKPKRIQGAYISEEEIQKVVGFIKDNNRGIDREEEPRFENGKENNYNGIDFKNDFNSEDEDELLEEAVKTVIDSKKASASLLQRRLKVGYARAARLLDIMEARGIIGPGEGAKPREVYLDKTNE